MRACGHEQTEEVPPEVTERAVRMVFEHEQEHPSPSALRRRDTGANQHETPDAHQRSGVSLPSVQPATDA